MVYGKGELRELSALTHLAKWDQLNNKIMFELSDVRRMISRNQLPWIFYLYSKIVGRD